MTGLVASLEVSVSVTQSLEESDVESMTEEVQRTLNVTEEDIVTTGKILSFSFRIIYLDEFHT